MSELDKKEPGGSQGTAGGQGPNDPSTCDRVRERLLEAHDPEDHLDAHTEQHLQGCQACRDFRAQLLVIDGLTRAQAPELPVDFNLALRRRLKEQEAQELSSTEGPDATDSSSSGEPDQKSWWPHALAAAALLLVAAGALWIAARSGEHDPGVTYHSLRISVHADQHHGEVLVDLDLPKGIRTPPALEAALGRDGHLRWRSTLALGHNKLELPLVARRRAGGLIRARLSVGSRVLIRTVNLNGSRSRAAADPAGQSVKLAWDLRDRGPTRLGGLRP